ncbi:MAG: DUF2206 domain-containing protein, partial [Methanobacterium sp.]
TFQILIWIFLCFDLIGIQIPILTPVITLIYLIFIPGILVLKYLDLEEIGFIEILLFGAGISIGILMFTGLIVNVIYPLIGVTKPISTIPLIITINAVVLILILLGRNHDITLKNKINYDILLTPAALFLCLIPFLTIFGTYLINFYNINLLIMASIIVIGLVPVLVGFNLISRKLYPLALFTVSISLLFHNSLISLYLTGYDIQIEHYISNLVYLQGIWNYNLEFNFNASLSIPILAPIFAILCKMDITWVFKVIYPFIFSLISLGLYSVYKKQTNAKIAFLAVFLFVSSYSFYHILTQLARQEIAELFLVLFLLILVSTQISKIKRIYLLIIFSLGLIVSHYALTYIFNYILILSLIIPLLAGLILKFGSVLKINNLSILNKKIDALINLFKVGLENIYQIRKRNTINLGFVVLIVIFTLMWYVSVTNSSAINTAIHILIGLLTNFSKNLINPQSREIAIQIASNSTWTHQTTLYLYLLSNIFLTLGILISIFKLNERFTDFKLKFEGSYILFSIGCFIILFMTIVLPNFAMYFTDRIYHITLIFLAPFCIIGLIVLPFSFTKLFNKNWKKSYSKNVYKIIGIFLAIFLIFNSGLAYQLANDNPNSISFNTNLDTAIYSQEEVSGAMWINENTVNSTVYGDEFGELLLAQYIFNRSVLLHEFTENLDYNSYIYLRKLNVQGQIKVFNSYYIDIKTTPLYLNLISRINRVYDSGDCQIYG